jgi:hypothetical protein
MVESLQLFPIPKWKWEVFTIYFITEFPRIKRKHDSIMVVVGNLTKSTYFIPVKTTQKKTNIADIYMKEIGKIHGVPTKIMSNKDSKFTAKFLKGLC